MPQMARSKIDGYFAYTTCLFNIAAEVKSYFLCARNITNLLQNGTKFLNMKSFDYSSKLNPDWLTIRKTNPILSDWEVLDNQTEIALVSIYINLRY